MYLERQWYFYACLRYSPTQRRKCREVQTMRKKTSALARAYQPREKHLISDRMSANYIKVTVPSSIKEAMSTLVWQAGSCDNISTIYLVDSGGFFVGALDLKELIIAREGTPLTDIMMTKYPYLYASTPVEDCLWLFTECSEETLPVLDESNRLVGAVTTQDIVEMLDDEFGDDYAKLGGLSSQEDMSEPVGKSVAKRIPWLCILLVMGLGVSATVGLFESIVAQLPIIMCFQSLILDMAGNVGTQSLAVAIRVLSDPRMEMSHKARLVWKEGRVGLVNGVLLGMFSFVAIGGYLCLRGNSATFAFSVSACIGLAMLAAMTVSSLSGTLIPIFFRSVGVDPAVASGPLITTVNDLVAVVTYYGLAYIILICAMGIA